ncbi:MAG: NUDIX domain-containing protein [Alphaproteobacteria bacterium]|jgi:8-oxo-dGTP pyrophosphatase MutT (NUDIX family)|nr:NUDIX domain-containing protein [Alphaproteobacteria bacterium]|tara:strand:- start:4296 stop:4808 length:513 start_codon:yes stop_codon:yes gene_type:complete
MGTENLSPEMEIILPETLIPWGKTIAYAAVAMLVSEDGEYLLQLRDGTPGIWYPEILCFFGGRIDAGEDAETALRRELMEELEFSPRALTYFSFICYGTARFEPGIGCRCIYEVEVTKDDMAAMKQHEGAGTKLLSPEEVLSHKHPISPVDMQMLYVHIMGRGLAPQPTG